MDNAAGTSNAAQQEVKITPANRAVLKTLKDLSIKKARADHHRGLLTTAISDGQTIAGLRREIRPQLPEIPVDFAIEWEEAHIVFSDTLTRLLAKYWNAKKDTIEDEITKTMQKLALTTSEQESVHITSITHTTFESEVTKLDAPKPQRPPKSIWPRAKRRRGGDVSTQRRNTEQ